MDLARPGWWKESSCDRAVDAKALAWRAGDPGGGGFLKRAVEWAWEGWREGGLCPVKDVQDLSNREQGRTPVGAPHPSSHSNEVPQLRSDPGLPASVVPL